MSRQEGQHRWSNTGTLSVICMQKSAKGDRFIIGASNTAIQHPDSFIPPADVRYGGRESMTTPTTPSLSFERLAIIIWQAHAELAAQASRAVNAGIPQRKMAQRKD